MALLTKSGLVSATLSTPLLRIDSETIFALSFTTFSRKTSTNLSKSSIEYPLFGLALSPAPGRAQ